MNNVQRARTGSRQSILDRLDSRPLEVPPLPSVNQSNLTRFDDPIARFVEILSAVGGQAHPVDHPQQALQILNSMPEFSGAQKIASLVPEVCDGNVDLTGIDDPHALESLDWVIAPGDFIVAENGAIWVDGARLPHRVLLFIPQFLALIVPRSQVVHQMHEAYARIGHPQPGFGIFVSGPSKTADIEQSLVLGAHGCRELQVFLTDQ